MTAKFLRAVGTVDIEAVRRALAEDAAIVNAVGPHPFWGGRPQALHVAVEAGRREIFDLLLDAGANPAGSNEEYDDWSPLMLAIQRNRHSYRDALLGAGAPVGLLEALLSGDDSRVRELLGPGKSALPARTPNGGSLLMFARTRFAIDRLLECGVPIDVKDRWGTTPIQAFSRLGPGGQELVRHLIGLGVKASAEEYARLGDLNALMATGPDDYARNEVMQAAVERGHTGVVRWLAGHGADVNARPRGGAGQTLLHDAAWNGDLAMAQLLVALGARVDARDAEHNQTPAGWARTAVVVRNDARCAAVAEWLASRAAETS